MQDLIQDMGIGDKLEDARALQAWSDVAGDQINNQTKRTWIKKGKLTVVIASSVWRHELHLQRSQWLRRVNEALGRDYVKELVFR